MQKLSGYKESSADWRRQLRRNESRTRFVIFLFIFIYLALGFALDIYLYSDYTSASISQIAMALITFQITPMATITMGIVAAISIFVTFAYHDKIVMLGTNYKEITPETENTLAEKQLYNVVEEMKIAAGLNYMPRVFIINADYMNAFASGYSEKSALVAITRGLMNKLDRAQLQAVMAHELSHIRHHDIKLTLTAMVLSNIMLIVIDFFFYSMIFGRRRREGGNALFLVIILLRYLLPVITVLLMMYLSRTREYMADAGCVELMRDNEPLAKALLKIDQDHQHHRDNYRVAYGRTPHEDIRRAAYIYDPVKAGIEPVKSVSSLFRTHPTLADRLKALGFSKSPE